MVKKIGNMWDVVHAHAMKKGSKRDKPKGSVIKKFTNKQAALAMHRAIMANR